MNSNADYMKPVIITFQKSIGKLRSIEQDERTIDLENVDFAIKETNIRNWNDNGQKSSYNLQLFINGESNPFKVNNILFDNNIEYVIKKTWGGDEHTSWHNYYYTIVINGKNSDGICFEQRFGFYGYRDIRLIIIYLIRLISEIGVEKTKMIADYFGYDKAYRLDNIELWDLIKNMDEIKTIFKRLLEKYDFLESFYQEGMKVPIESATKRLKEFMLKI